jgi:peptidyl-prolyl cis-trans isomerase C
MLPALRLLSLLSLTLVACERAPAPGRAEVDVRHTRQEGGTPVARWQGDMLTAEALEQRFLEMSPALRERYQTPEAKREYVESVARFELLAHEALARGLQDDPEVLASFKRALVNRLMRQQLEQTPTTVTEAEVAEAYAREKESFSRPAQVRLSHIFLAAPRGDTAQVDAARARAEALMKQVRALPPGDFGAFGKLAREQSEEPRTQLLDGDMRFLSDEALARTYGPEVLEAARGLKESGDVTGPVQTEQGFHLLKLNGRRCVSSSPSVCAARSRPGPGRTSSTGWPGANNSPSMKRRSRGCRWIPPRPCAHLRAPCQAQCRPPMPPGEVCLEGHLARRAGKQHRCPSLASLIEESLHASRPYPHLSASADPGAWRPGRAGL